MPKCSFCDKEAVGVIPMGMGHAYVCENHAKEKEAEGWEIDYDNWRLSTRGKPK